MNRAPVFSVIVPVFNDTEGLERCLEALSQQTLSGTLFEVLVADNGSTRPIQEVASRFPFASYINEPKVGSYNARNAACDVAKGEFLAFTDADCIPHCEWLSSAAQYFNSAPTVSAIGGRLDLITPENANSAELYETVFAFRQEKYIAENGFAVTANLIVRHSAFKDVGPFNGAVRSGGDRDWGHRMHIAGKIMHYVSNVRVAHPARANLAALIKKRRRVEGGRAVVPAISKRYPHWSPKRHLAHPTGLRMGLLLALDPGAVRLKQPQGLQVLFVAGLLTLVGWLERVRLASGGDPLR